MKIKKILSLILASAMILSALMLSGCDDGSNNDENETSGIVTLNMFVITEKETSKEAAKRVQMAINEITVPQYKMLVKINYYTADEYWDALYAAEKEAVKYIEDGKPPISSAEDYRNIAKMTFNEAIDYAFELKDVDLLRPQLDIFVVDDYDKFLKMAREGRLSAIDVTYDRKVLTKYIHPTIMAAATVDKKVYGVPTNFAMDGRYEFLVFNKELLDKYDYTVHDLRDIEKMGGYLELIKQNEPDYYPINDLPELAGGVETYDNLLYTTSDLISISQSTTPMFLNNTKYIKFLKAVKSYEESGYVAAADGVTDAKYAIELVYSDRLLDKEWEEDGVKYQAYLYDLPRVSAREAFEAAMCVSAYSLNSAKAAKLVELFNTDWELADMLQYGIRGEHYRLEDDVVVPISVSEDNTYKMDNFLTGNIYVKHSLEGEQGYVEDAKITNISVAPSAFFGFEVTFSNASDESVYRCVEMISKKAISLIESGEMSIDDAFNIANKELNALGCTWNSDGTALQGVFGNVCKQMEDAAKNNTKFYKSTDEVKRYNEKYLSKEELAEMEREIAEAEAAAAAAEGAEGEEGAEGAAEGTDGAENSGEGAEEAAGEEAEAGGESEAPEEDGESAQ